MGRAAAPKSSNSPVSANLGSFRSHRSNPLSRFLLVLSTYAPPSFTVTFGLNVRLDLSGKATTKSLCSLGAELILEILGESTWVLIIWMIRGDEGVGDIPGVRGGSRESLKFCATSSIDTRTQT